MVLKQILRLLFVCILILGTGIAQEKTKYPAYYKSNPSTRFVTTSSSTQSTSQVLQKGNPSLIQSTIPETLKVMAIRVQFQRDNDRSTTGDGLFDMTIGDSMINPPPHNQQYFSNQLRALRDYYLKVSGGKLTLQVENENGVGYVYPLEPDSAWTLPHQMSYYNPDETEEVLDQRLGELLRDAIVVADQSGEIDFSKFDVFIIFHAGVGWEFTQDFDTTPKDIPSVFLNFNDLKKTIGNGSVDYKGISVNNGASFIKEGIILPETENQSGYNFFGLIGTAALMMGHQLGLPNLFDTDTGHPGVGRFGMMDQGSGNFFGNIPAQPCAWSKIFLGWEKPIIITSGDLIPVAASLAANPNKIYKIPINAKEYFLIENRQRNVLQTRNIGIGYDQNGTRIEFYDDGDYEPKTGIGVITSIDEYDFGIPGSGILIWHIDETVIEQNYAENRVNADMSHRGVDLTEADGSQDMGYYYNNFGFTGYHAGYAEDMWWDQNEAHLFANSSEQVMFTPNTMPSSQAHSRANTEIHITEFSPLDSIMYFSLKIKVHQPGFPAYMGEGSGNSAIVVGDLNGDGQSEIVAANENGKILVWKADGEKLIDNEDFSYQVNINGDTTKLPLAVFAEINNGQFLHSPSLADLDHDGDLEVISSSTNGKLYAWQGVDLDENGRADLYFELDCGAPISTVPVIGDWSLNETGQEIAVGLETGDIYLIQESGELTWKKTISGAEITGLAGFFGPFKNGLICVDSQSRVTYVNGSSELIWQKSFSQYGALNYSAVGDLVSDGNRNIVLTSDQGYIIILDESGELSLSSNVISVGVALSSPTLADINSDQFLDIVAIGGGKIFAYNFNGVPLTYFPIIFDQSLEDAIYSEPILVDLDGDEKSEILVASKNNQLMAFNYKGDQVEGFPLSVAQPITSSPVISDLDNDGKLNLIARSSDNYGYVWHLDYDFEPERVFWGQFQRDAQHSGLYVQPINPPVREGALMPEKMVYNYPNPTEGNSTTIRYYLNDAAEVSIRIYDMAGELVEELPGPGLAGIENEVIWDITNVQSGVYLTRVFAKGENESNVAIIKIAVVK